MAASGEKEPKVQAIPDDPEARQALLRSVQEAMGQELFNQAVRAISGPTSERVCSIKPPLSLIQARTALDGRVNFEELQARTARDFERWGLGNGFVIPEDASVGESGDENKLKALFEADRKKPQVLVVPNMKPADLFRVLFVEAGLPVYRDSYGFKNLKELRRVNPRDIPGLSELHEKSSDEQLAAFAEAHGKAPALQQSGVRVLFTPESQHAEQSVGESATRIAQRAGGAGEVPLPHLNLAAEFVRARQMVDGALRKVVGSDEFEALSPEAYRDALKKAFNDRTIDQYMPAWDRGSVTRSPLEIFPNGGVSALCWHPDGRSFRVEYCSPGNAGGSLGGRASLA